MSWENPEDAARIIAGMKLSYRKRSKTMAKGGPLLKNSYAKNKPMSKNVYGGARMGNPYAKSEKRETP